MRTPALLLAMTVAVAVSSPARADAPASPVAAEACDATWLASLPHFTHKDADAKLALVEARMQRVLAEEARVEKTLPAKAPQAFSAPSLVMLGFIVGWVLALGYFATRRRPLRMVLLLLPIAVLVAVPLGAMRDARRRATLDATRAQLLDLARCRASLEAARVALQHTELAACVSNLAEVDEDLTSLSATIRNGGHPTVGDVEKVRKEMSER